MKLIGDTITLIIIIIIKIIFGQKVDISVFIYFEKREIKI